MKKFLKYRAAVNAPRSRRGETFVEILVAILIIALSAGLFAAMYSASMNLDLFAKQQDKLFYDAVEQLEELIEGKDGTGTKQEGEVAYVPVKDGTEGDGTTVPVEIVTDDGMTGYRAVS